MSYQSDYSGAQVVEAVGKALNPDATPTEGSTNLVQSGGVASAVSTVGNAVSRRNLLDNAYFVGGGSQQGGGQFPVNQRGQTVYSAGSYGIDRWVMYAPSGDLQSDGLHSAVNESIAQYLESSLINALNGKTVTMSVLTSDGLFAGSIVYDKTVTQYFNAQGITLVKGVGGNGSNYAQVFTSSPTVVYAAKLELGSNQTLAHQENGVWVLNEIPNFAEELAKCQRYYWEIKASAAYALLALGMGTASNVASFKIQHPVTMRDSASVTVSGTFGCNSAAFASATLRTNSGTHTTNYSVIEFDTTISQGAATTLQDFGSNNATVKFSAEL